MPFVRGETTGEGEIEVRATIEEAFDSFPLLQDKPTVDLHNSHVILTANCDCGLQKVPGCVFMQAAKACRYIRGRMRFTDRHVALLATRVRMRCKFKSRSNLRSAISTSTPRTAHACVLQNHCHRSYCNGLGTR